MFTSEQNLAAVHSMYYFSDISSDEEKKQEKPDDVKPDPKLKLPATKTKRKHSTSSSSNNKQPKVAIIPDAVKFTAEERLELLRLCDEYMQRPITRKTNKLTRILPTKVSPKHANKLMNDYDATFEPSNEFIEAFREYVNYGHHLYLHERQKLKDVPLPNVDLPHYEAVCEFFNGFANTSEHPFATFDIQRYIQGGVRGFNHTSALIAKKELKWKGHIELDRSCVVNIVFYALLSTMEVVQKAQIKVMNTTDVVNRSRQNGNELDLHKFAVRAKDVELIHEICNEHHDPKSAYLQTIETDSYRLDWIPNDVDMRTLINAYCRFLHNKSYHSVMDAFRALTSDEQMDMGLLRLLSCYIEKEAVSFIRARLVRTAYFIIKDIYRCYNMTFGGIKDPNLIVPVNWEWYVLNFDKPTYLPLLARFENSTSFEHYIKTQTAMFLRDDITLKRMRDNLDRPIIDWGAVDKFNLYNVMMKYPQLVVHYTEVPRYENLVQDDDDEWLSQDEVQAYRAFLDAEADRLDLNSDQVGELYLTLNLYLLRQVCMKYDVGESIRCIEDGDLIFDAVLNVIKYQKTDQVFRRHIRNDGMRYYIENHTITHPSSQTSSAYRESLSYNAFKTKC